MSKRRYKKNTATVHMDPGGRLGWVELARSGKNVFPVTSVFDPGFKDVRTFKVPRKERKHIYIRFSDTLCRVWNPRPKRSRTRVVNNCGGPGNP